MKHPKVVFVDGPTAVGKGFFIENLVTHLTDKLNLSVEVIKAVDFVNKEATEINRNYQEYKTEETKINSIYEGHLVLLDHLVNILEDDVSHTDVVVVDRSFVSMLAYNLWQKDRIEFSEELLRNYKLTFKELMSEYKTVYVQLDFHPPEDVENSVNTILKRITSRNDNKSVDKGWFKELISNYKTRIGAMVGTTDSVILTHSGDNTELIKMFTPDIVGRGLNNPVFYWVVETHTEETKPVRDFFEEWVRLVEPKEPVESVETNCISKEEIEHLKHLQETEGKVEELLDYAKDLINQGKLYPTWVNNDDPLKVELKLRYTL